MIYAQRGALESIGLSQTRQALSRLIAELRGDIEGLFPLTVEQALSQHHWSRGKDLNLRPSGCVPDLICRGGAIAMNWR